MFYFTKEQIQKIAEEAFEEGLANSAENFQDYCYRKILNIKYPDAKISYLSLNALYDLPKNIKIFHPIFGIGQVNVSNNFKTIVFPTGSLKLSWDSKEDWSVPIIVFGENFS